MVPFGFDIDIDMIGGVATASAIAILSTFLIMAVLCLRSNSPRALGQGWGFGIWALIAAIAGAVWWEHGHSGWFMNLLEQMTS